MVYHDLCDTGIVA